MSPQEEWLQLRMHDIYYKNLPRLKRVDYIWESIVKAIKIQPASDGLITIENAQCMP